MIARTNAKAEKALREALGNVAQAEPDQIEQALAGLDQAERNEALALSLMITCYVVVDVCESQWPDDASVRRIAQGLATVGTTAERLRLDADEIYAYLSRTVLGSEPLESLIPGEPMFTRFPIIVAQRAIVVYSPKDMSMWDYLDQVENAIEVASALGPSVLPAAVMRAYLPKATAEG
jgi:hypothetical protein